jgi:high affinity Mn2+ porin
LLNRLATLGEAANTLFRISFNSTVRALAIVLLAGTCCAQETPGPPAEGGGIPRQQENKETEAAVKPERWNLYYQATSVGQYHGTFPSPYQGANSLHADRERDVSLTTTLYLGLQLGKNTQLYFDPEIAGGKGFSAVTGLANFSNGELPRVGSATPKPYLARLYLTHDFGWGEETEAVESEENQLAGSRPMNRYTVTLGRFTLTDFFDNNRYSHDPRTQFMGWGVMYNGAWDYPADVRGYTWGIVQELHRKNWSLRTASAAEPRIANGLRLDRRLLRNRGDVVEGEYRYQVLKHPGTVRLLGSLQHTFSGHYAEALQTAAADGSAPNIHLSARNGTLKYGWGVNAEQELTKDIGVFGRYAWNDGETESFAYTAIDRLATIGVSVTGTRWHRKNDTMGTEITSSGLSAIHALYLARGGLDFIIGDGQLRYGRENIWESYYSAKLFSGFFVSYDLQHAANPAYNQDRGPLWISSLRLHLEIGPSTHR